MKREMLSWVLPIIGAVLILHSISRTVMEWIHYAELQTSAERMAGTRTNGTTSDFRFFFSQEQLVSKKIMQLATENCYQADLRLVKIFPPVIHQSEGVGVLTQRIAYQGGFLPMLKCFQQGNTRNDSLKISSLKFELERTSPQERPHLKTHSY